MSMSLNRAQLIGNLTRDPELRQTSGGRTVANFGIATNRRWTGSDGQKQEKTEFHNIVVWGKLAEICGQYLRKGSKIYIDGRIETRDWEGEDGVKRYRTEIVADNMIMLDRKGDAVGGQMADREPAGIGVDEPAKDDAPPVNDKNDKEEVAVEDLPF